MSIGRFFNWWIRELASLVPRAGFGARRTVLVADIGRDAVRFLRRDGDRETLLAEFAPGTSGEVPLGSLSPERTPCEVVVRDALGLEKRVDLPLAAEENLAQVLEFEMERLTPFPAAQVYFGFHPAGRDRDGGRIAVDLSVMPRRVVDPVLDMLPGWSVAPAREPVPAPDGDGVRITFHDARYRSQRGGAFNLVLAVLAVVLLAGAVALPLERQRVRLATLERALDVAREEASAAADVESRLEARAAELRYLYEQREALPTVVEILEALSAAIPDETWVHRLELKEDRVYVQGSSATASALIGALEASAYFADVRFDAGVVRDTRNDGRDRFQLSAEIRRRSAPGEGA